jgi:hypothetical protein
MLPLWWRSKSSPETVCFTVFLQLFYGCSSIKSVKQLKKYRKTIEEMP